MNSDEKAIRDLISTWQSATAADDLPRVLELMAEDVVFLVAGHPPMRGRDQYAAAARANAGKVRFDGSSEIQEIRVFGDWAYTWTQLSVTTMPIAGGEPTLRKGPTLSIFRKQEDGAWVLFRDANLLTAQPAASA
jgi:uncharacterized protein (TIGR02246 family)